MLYTYIKFENQTQAQKAKSLLAKNGIRSQIKRNPNPDRKQGCNFALFTEGNIYRAYDIISNNYITNLGVETYRERL